MMILQSNLPYPGNTVHCTMPMGIRCKENLYICGPSHSPVKLYCSYTSTKDHFNYILRNPVCWLQVRGNLIVQDHLDNCPVEGGAC